MKPCRLLKVNSLPFWTMTICWHLLRFLKLLVAFKVTNVDLIYSDEDKTNEDERRFDPFFKPDFSPDYLRSVNYMPHFLVVRKSLGDPIGWFREGYDGAQDFDLILRLVEKARAIAHIPKILYHWRVWTDSTAGGANSKPYANKSGKKALQRTPQTDWTIGAGRRWLFSNFLSGPLSTPQSSSYLDHYSKSRSRCRSGTLYRLNPAKNNLFKF